MQSKAKSPDALIGHTGFVGKSLLRQRAFDYCFNSSNIESIRGETFDLIICAGAPAKKWVANSNPLADKSGIDRLVDNLSFVRCRRFVLISTVDVFIDPTEVDEDTGIETDGLHAYGFNRRVLELGVAALFPDHLIVRLPGLVGPGLMKNVVYDIQHDNNVDRIDPRGLFQFYPMVNLWYDLQTGLSSGARTLHLTAEPITVEDLVMEGFGLDIAHLKNQSSPPAKYDMRSKYAALLGNSWYQYSKRETIQAVRHYAQTEPRLGGLAMAKSPSSFQ
jgi:hypothetical protein